MQVRAARKIDVFRAGPRLCQALQVGALAEQIRDLRDPPLEVEHLVNLEGPGRRIS
jgi:hypothetical protein